MSPTYFKLSKQDGLIRRISFDSRPNWSGLASRIQALYDIPIQKVGVSYIDSDGDEVTLSSDEELQDFYNDLRGPSGAVRFAVQDLRALRELQDPVSKALPETLHNTNPRNTFGGMEGLMFDMDDDWQRLPAGLFRQDSPHAFVEVVDSDVNSISKIDQFDTSSVGSNVDVAAQSQQKGKSRAYEASDDDSISSTGSVLAENAPAKHAVHVYDISAHSQSRASTPGHTVLSAGSHHSTAVPIVAESTPKATVQALNSATPPAPESPLISNEAIPDPPLPTFDPPLAQNTLSLSNDVTSLLNTLTNIVSSHPELSEGLRNIVRNTTNGAYWNAHREAMSRAEPRDENGSAVDGMTRFAEEVRRKAEQEAGRRVTEALGGIFRALSESGGATSRATEAAPQQSTNWPDLSANRDRISAAPSSFNSQWHSRPQGWLSSDTWGARARPPFGPPPFSQHPWRASWSHPSPPFIPPLPGSANTPLHPGLPPYAPAPPPPPQMHPPPPGPPPPPHGPPPHWPPPHGPVPPPHGPAPPPHAPPPPRGPPPLPHPGPPGPPGGWHWSSPSPRPKLTSQELRAQVELAKYNYKTEKERYRKERDERRKDRERIFGETTVVEGGVKKLEDGAPVPTAQIVSNARGPYPQLEMVSVPRRHNTYSGPPTRRDVPGPSAAEGTEARAAQRISRRLADMGFTENAYPSLPKKIKTQMPPTGVVNKDSEDDIVTTLLEELLSMSPKPAASGSGMRRDRDIPGAWH